MTYEKDQFTLVQQLDGQDAAIYCHACGHLVGGASNVQLLKEIGVEQIAEEHSRQCTRELVRGRRRES
jgi:hypothetical protein